VAPGAAYDLLGTARKGLTAAEAAERLEVFGENVLTAKAPKPMWMRFGAHLVNMFAICCGSPRCSRSSRAAPGWAIILVILLNAVFAFGRSFAPRRRSALKNMLPPMAKVVRDGRISHIEARCWCLAT
jgi:magnesium-transporting ATPase (P-type)